MSTASPKAGAPTAPTEAEFLQERMARAAPRDPDAPAPPRRRRRARELGGGGFKLGWKSWLVIDILAVALLVVGVVAWPPFSACREQDRKVGFYAGDSLGKCVRSGIGERLTRADQRIKMLVRGSGQ